MINRISNFQEAITKIDAALKPTDEDLAKARIVGAHLKPEMQDTIVARSIWSAAREGLAKAFAASRITEIAERRSIDPDTVDYNRTEESIWSLPANIAMRLAEDVQDGGSGLYLWQPVLTSDERPAYHSW